MAKRPQNSQNAKSLAIKRLKEDFRVFLTKFFKDANIGKPTPMQYLLADILQKETHRQVIFLGFRGFAKTTILAIFDLWILYRNPKLQTAFWGSNEANAGDTTQFMLDSVRNIPWLQHLAPLPDQDQSGLAFDVRGKGLFRGNSVRAYGISGSVTGTRGDWLMIDDPETSTNAETTKKREHIERAMEEASYVITNGGSIRVLGTIHFDDSIYLRLMNKGYKVYIFPICVPDKETQELCWEYYPEPLRKMMEKLPVGTPLDRFGPEEIELKRQNGLISFQRQCLCNPFRTSLTRKPLNLKKLIIFPADTEQLPIRFFHSQDNRFLAEEVMAYSSASLSDKLYKPYQWDEKMRPYDRRICVVDPAGSGKDELAVAVLGAANGYAVLFSIEGMVGGSSDENLTRILETARRFKCQMISVENNLGQGMFAQLLRAKYFELFARFGRDGIQIPIGEHRATKNKEKRIMANLDPVINSGRLIITPDALELDYTSANVHQNDNKMAYRLTYQLSYFSEEGQKLDFDDRIDVLSSGIELLKGFLADQPEVKATRYEQSLLDRIFKEDEKQFQPIIHASPNKKHIATRNKFLK